MADQTETILVVNVDDSHGTEHYAAHYDGVAHYHYSPTGDSDNAVCIREPGPRPVTPSGRVDLWGGWKRTHIDEYLAVQAIDAEQFACSCEYIKAVKAAIAEARSPKAAPAFPFDFASLIPGRGFEAASVDSVLVSGFEVNGVERRVLIPQVQYLDVGSVGIFPNLRRGLVDSLPRTELPIHVCIRQFTKIEVRAQAPEEGKPFMGYEVTIS